jgi:uncharacterized membrane protein YccC
MKNNFNRIITIVAVIMMLIISLFLLAIKSYSFAIMGFAMSLNTVLMDIIKDKLIKIFATIICILIILATVAIKTGFFSF